LVGEAGLQEAELREREEVAPPEDYEAPLREHLMELLTRLRRAAAAVLIASLLASVVPASLDPYTPLLFAATRFIIYSMVPDQVTAFGVTVDVALVQTGPFTGILVMVKTALLLGVILASPYIAWEIYEFVKPGLYLHERRLLQYTAVAGAILFLLGAAIALKVVLPLGFKFAFIASASLYGDRLVAFADVNRVLTIALLGTIGIGLAYELPVVTYFAVRLGVVSPEAISGDKGKLLLVAVMALAAVITPDGTGIGMVLLGLPLYIAVRIAAWLGARHRKVGKPEW